MIMSVLNTIIAVGDFLWGMPMLIFLCVVSVLYTYGNKGFQFTHFRYIMKHTFGRIAQKEQASQKGISSFKAMCMALCNTLGVGNIAGIALAIAMGGPGAVFWVWIAGLLAMIIKYGEITLGVKYQETDPETGIYKGGIMYYIQKGLSRRWHWIASAYAVIYTIAMVNAPAVQTNTIASSITAYLDIPSLWIGVVLALLMVSVLVGGVRRISDFAGVVVPFMSLTYILMAVIVLLMNIREIPQAFGLIFKYAVTDVSAVAGGFGGATVALAARYGLARGFYSNGAGTGDAPFAHSSADVSHPAEQGMWGISEVVVDTVVCTCTALVILVTGAWKTGETGAALTAEAFSLSFRSTMFGNIFISIIILFFGFTTALACAYIGEICFQYFTKNKIALQVYRFIICFAAACATNPMLVERIDILWRVGDFNTAVSIMLSLLTLVLLRKDVCKETEEYKSIIDKEGKVQKKES